MSTHTEVLTEVHPRLRTTKWRWLLALLPIPLILAAIYTGSVFSLLPGFDQWLATTSEPLAVVAMVAQTGLVLAAAVALLWLVLRLQGSSLAAAGWVWTKHSAPALALGLGLTVAVVLPSSLIITALGLGRDLQATGGASPLAVAVVGLAMAFLLQGIPEELLFRGYLLHLFADRPVRGVWVSTAVFTVIHLVSSGGQRNALEHVLYLAIPFGFGLLAGALALTTRSLWSAVGVHAGFHVATLLGVPFDLRSGPVLWVVTGGLLGAIGLVVLTRYQRNLTPASETALSR